MPSDACQLWSLGDLDNSNSIEIFDVLLLADIVVTNSSNGICPDSVSDFNQDNTIDAVDILLLANHILFP